MTIDSRRAMLVLLATGLSTLGTSEATAAPSPRDYTGPEAPGEPPQNGPAKPPSGTPPAEAPPAETPPAETPPAESPPAETPPAEIPPKKTDPVAPADPEEDAWDGGFDVVDLTEDKEALKKELEVKTIDVKGDSGVLRGKIRDATTGQPIIGGYVEAIGTPYKTKTDLDGNYVLELPPGTYEVRLRSDANEPRRVSGVVVAKGSDETVNAELQPLAGANQVVAVKAEMNRESEGARMLQRKESAATRDIMSRDEIKKSGGGSTTAVAARIVGATIIDGKYVFVRGLGHRYGNTLFDGARVPSPEPELRTVPLDIFPSAALSAINVQKTFTPDMPGDFAGASVQLESREVPKPKELVAELYADVGFNTRTTFQDMVHNGPFPGADAFGFGNLPRKLPSVLPTDRPANRGELDENFQPYYTPEQMERFGHAMYTDTKVRRGRLAPPNFGARGTIGYGWTPHDNAKMGFLAVASYRSLQETLRREIRQFGNSTNDDGEQVLENQVNLRSLESNYNVQWSTVGLFRYDINKHNRLNVLGFYSRDADDETRELRGTVTPVTTDPVANTRLRYTMRSVLLTRLGGRHEIPKAKNFTIDWFGSYGQARRDDPAMRDMFFTDANEDGVYSLDVGNDAGKQLFMELEDHSETGSLNFTMPFEQWGQLASKVKVGVWVEGKQREFNVRRFTFDYLSTLADQIPDGMGNIINDGTIGGGLQAGQGGTEPFVLEETTFPFDNYRANQEVYATYAMLDLPFVRWFRMVGGARFEANNVDVRPFDLFSGDDITELDDGTNARGRLRDRDVLPSAGLIFSPTDKMNVRFSGTRTVARPEFRELAPFAFTDFVGGVDVIGNPELTRTSIWNADARWEWFPSASEVLAASVFYKRFGEPIEQVIVPRSTQVLTYRNARAADMVGAEVELRKNLEFIWKRLSDLSIGFNAAYSYSRVRLQPSCVAMAGEVCDSNETDISTSRNRPLQGQAPFVANAFLDYENKKSGTTARIMYNVITRKISYVGAQGLPDIYEQPWHQLDLNVSQRLYKGLYMRLAGLNLVDARRWYKQGDQVWRSWRRGAQFWVGLGYDF